MMKKILSAVLIVVLAFALLALLDHSTRQITETDTDTETESATVGTANAVVWLYLPDVAKKPYKSIVLMGDELGEALRYLDGIEFKEANGKPEEPLTEMYVAVDTVRGYTMTYVVDSIEQVWVYIDEDCLWIGVHQRWARMKGGE